jgi:8-oxo-dGTP diphosphatase
VKPEIHVVAGILRDGDGRVLIAQRPTGKPLAGRWEFPGGKLTPGEPPHDALVRELREELGIEVVAAARRMLYAAEYPERYVWLDVWDVLEWRGEPRGLDAQALAWIAPGELCAQDILEADSPIVAGLGALSAVRASTPPRTGR